jgi:NAD(P)-dependent dehydrogenase (short-subunit alcohol dehydrogenase family)
VVTGASRGIGKGIAVELGAAGATVYVTGRTGTADRAAMEPSGRASVAAMERNGRASVLPGTVPATAAEIDAAGGVGVPMVCDHREDKAVAEVFDRVREEHGRLDILVNNVYNAPANSRWLGKPFWEVPARAWDETFDIGVRSHYVAAVHAAPLLIAARGLIVNISSPGAVRYMHNAVYGIAKAAVDRLTADLAHDLADTGVTVVSLWPGIVDTELLQTVPPDASGRRIIAIPGEPPVDLAAAETPHFPGRAVVALAGDPDVHTRTGTPLTTAALAAEYGFVDIR